MPSMKEKDELLMQLLFKRDHIRTLMRSVFGRYRKMINDSVVEPEVAVREGTALWIALIHHATETRMRFLTSMVKIRDYDTPFKNIIPVRCQEEIDHFIGAATRENEEVLRAYSGDMAKAHFEDVVSLVMSEIYPVSTHGWEAYAALKSKLFGSE